MFGHPIIISAQAVKVIEIVTHCIDRRYCDKGKAIFTGVHTYGVFMMSNASLQ